MDDVAIRVDHVSKSFKLPHEKNTSVKGALISFAHHKKGYEIQQALKDVSFEVKKGEFFGIVGRNGSGKSTLLKMLAGIYTPSSGSIKVNGKLTPFIELGVGFSPELTGRENVFLNGSLLGFNRREMATMYDDIVEFAELERFMDQKLKNYSSGMQVRLAFSIAIRANTDILVLDEVLAVGDANFQQKCNDYFAKLKKDSTTIVLVTHDMGAVSKYCDRAILIHDGVVESIGKPDDIANQYKLENYDPNRLATTGTKELSSMVKSLDLKVKSPIRLTSNDIFEFEVEYSLYTDAPVYIGVGIINQGVAIAEHNSKAITLGHNKNTNYRVTYRLPLRGFGTESFKINIAIFKRDNGQIIGYKSDACEFFVKNNQKFKGGPVITDGTWEQEDE